MSPSELSSIKWEHDGEMSAQDTWNLVKKLIQVEEQDQASSLLHLSSKHSHSKIQPRRSLNPPARQCNDQDVSVHSFSAGVDKPGKSRSKS